MARTQLEPTGKVFKAIMAIGVLLAIIGVVRFAGATDDDPGAGLLLMIFGFALVIVGKVLAWWKHG